jgi:putative ABC transport system permease protein
MNWFERLWRPKQMDEQLDKELRFHVEQHAADLVARGLEPAEARRRARLAMGGPEQVKEKCRDARGTRWVEELAQDIRHALRTLWLQPGFAAVCVITLALGIGANTAIFELLDTVRLRTLPVEKPQELRQIRIDQPHGRTGTFTTRYPSLTYPLWEQIRARQQGFSGVLAWAPWPFNIAESGEVQRAEGIWVSGEFFDVLGVRPIIGRVFSTADDAAGCAGGAVISYSFWQRQYGGRAEVLGERVPVNHHTFEIVGVTPPGFYGVDVGHAYDIALPLCAEPIVQGADSALKQRHTWWLTVVGRLKRGWTDEKAAAQLRAVSPAIFGSTVPPEFNAKEAAHFQGYKLGVLPGATGNSDLRQDYADPLILLLVLAGLVLLIACGNLTNLLLARGTARAKEMALRLAIGASRARLIRQLLVESLLISVIGAAAGVAIARWLAGFLVAFLSTSQNPLFANLATDWEMLTFTAGLATLTCVLIGLAPAVRATSVAPGAVLKTGSRGAAAGPERSGLKKALVVAQVALSLVLVTGALLFTRSLAKVMTENAGFVQDKILVADIDYTSANIPAARQLQFQLDLIDRMRRIPGVLEAASTAIVPITGSSWNQNVLYSPRATDSPGVSSVNEVSDDYFRALGIRLIAGRDFTRQDALDAPAVAIVNQKFAGKYFAHQNPVGQHFSLQHMDVTKDVPMQIVGVVGDTKYDDMHTDPPPIVYLPLSQDDAPSTDITLMIRSQGPLDAIRSGVSEATPDINPDLRLWLFKTQIGQSLLRDRLMAILSGFFGALAALLAMIGVYGLISYTVAGRQSEFGIRMALGAQRKDILRIVMREAVLLLVLGAVAGVTLAMAGAHEAASLLYGLEPYDPATVVMAVAALAVITSAAASIPALRASRTDPAAALRQG